MSSKRDVLVNKQKYSFNNRSQHFLLRSMLVAVIVLIGKSIEVCSSFIILIKFSHVIIAVLYPSDFEACSFNFSKAVVQNIRGDFTKWSSFDEFSSVPKSTHILQYAPSCLTRMG